MENAMDRKRDENSSFHDGEGDGGKKGRIGRLDEQTLGYYRRVQENLNSDFQEQEDKDIFLSNVFKELSPELLKISQNQTASSIVENLLAHATSQQCLDLLQSMGTDWELACYDRFASHVTQSLLMATWRQLSRDPQADGDALTAQVTDVYSFIVSKLALHMQHTYASHIVRTLLEVLGGAKVTAEVIRSKVARQQPRGKPTAEFSSYRPITSFRDMFIDLCEKLGGLHKLEDHAKNYLSNPVLQTLLLVCHGTHSELCDQLSKQLVENTQMFISEDQNVPEMVTHETGSRLVEQVMTVANENQLSLILDQLQQHLVGMATHPSANFVVKKLIQVCRTAEQFEQVYSIISKYFEDVLAHSHFGIVVALAQGCAQHSVKQKKFIKLLQKSFHCYEPPERQRKLFPLLASLTAYEVFFKLPQIADDDKEDKDESSSEDEAADEEPPALTDTTLHGSLLLQELLRFSNPAPLVVSLLDLSTRELVTLACHPSGSRVLDVFFTSPTVGEQHRNQLLSRIKGSLMTLACDRNGSRTVDCLWSAISIKQKTVVAKELVKNESRIRTDRSGMHIWRNCALNHFKSRPDEWRSLQTGNMRKRKMFNEIINETDGTSSKKQRKMNSEEDGSSLLLEEPEQNDVTTMMIATQQANTTSSNEPTEPTSNTKSHKKKKKKKMEKSE